MTQRENNIIMSYEEHTICSNWMSDYNIGFKGYHLNTDDNISSDFGKDYNTICFLLKGKGILRYGENEFTLTEGSMFFIPSNVSCELEVKQKSFLLVNNFNKPIQTIINTCERMSLEKILPPINKDTEFYNPVIPIKKELGKFLNLLVELLDDGVYCKHFHNEEFNKFFFILRFYYTKDEIGILFAPILGQNMDFKHLVLKNYPHTESIRELAAKCGYSLATFNRLFVYNFHDTPYKWLQKKKLQHIIIRLSKKNVSIAQIAEEFGFSSPGHFTVFCKEFLHVTPSQFRKQQLQLVGLQMN
jgi:AraC-like DNA-binding protein